MRSRTKNIIKKNKPKKNTKKNTKLGGGKGLFENAKLNAKKKNNIVNGDILVAKGDKFIATLTGNTNESGDYIHNDIHNKRGIAKENNYNKTWVAISKVVYDRLNGQLDVPDSYIPVVIHKNSGGFSIINKRDNTDYSKNRSNDELVNAVQIISGSRDKFRSQSSYQIEWDNYQIVFIPYYMNDHYIITEYDGAETLELLPEKYKLDEIVKILDSNLSADEKIYNIRTITKLNIDKKQRS